MTHTIDTRFLTMHPRTALWHVQREQCRQCVHCKLTSTWRCELLPAPGMTGLEYCISARDHGQPCGPEAKLFEKKEAA